MTATAVIGLPDLERVEAPVAAEVHVELRALLPRQRLERTNASAARRPRGKTGPEALRLSRVSEWFRLFQEGWESGDEAKLGAAEKHYRQVVTEQPAAVSAWHILAGIEQARERFDLAMPLIDKALELQPEAAALHQTAGDLLRATGEHARAASAYERAVELNPEHFKAHQHLGCALLDMEEEGRALPHLRQATQLAPTEALSWFHLGRSLVALGVLSEGESCFHRHLGLDPGNALALLELARIRMRQGRLPQALELLRRVLASASDGLPAGSRASAASLGRSAVDLELDVHHYMAESGETEASLAGYRAVTSSDPDSVRAWVNLCVKFGPVLDESEVQAMRAQLERDGLTDEEQSGLHFGLAKVCDARGELAQAADHARRANRSFDALLRSKGRQDRPDEYRGLVDFHVALFSADYFDRPSQAGIVSDRPVFIVGMPRSGTSLVEQILASHPDVFGAGELMYVAGGIKLSSAEVGGRRQWKLRVRDRDRAFIQAAARRYLTQLSELDPLAARVTDKMPDNYLHLGWISAMFPGARIIHCRRDMRDVALSCWMNRLVNLAWSTRLEAIRERIVQYLRLMEHWSAVLPQTILHVRYEELTADLEGVAKRMIDHCGLPWDERCLAFESTRRVVNTASHQQVREPLHRRSVRRWEGYADILGSALVDVGE